jgi:hypothetical protein
LDIYGHKQKKKTTKDRNNHGDLLERSHDQTCVPTFCD